MTKSYDLPKDEQGYNGCGGSSPRTSGSQACDTNYETWNLKLWLDNEEPWYNEMTDQARRYVEDSEDQDGEIAKDFAISAMREYLQEWVTENTPDLHWPEDMGGGKIEASMFHDILNAGLSEINYHEIAEAYIGEAIEELAREKG